MADIIERLRRGMPSILAQRDAATELEGLYAAMDYHRQLVRELDVALNGEDGAAKQASLCDIVAQVKDQRWKLVRAT